MSALTHLAISSSQRWWFLLIFCFIYDQLVYKGFWLVVHSICGQGLWNFILMFKDYFLHTSRITVYFVKVVRSKMIESCVCLISGNSTAKRECVVGTLRSVIKNPIILFFFFFAFSVDQEDQLLQSRLVLLLVLAEGTQGHSPYF